MKIHIVSEKENPHMKRREVMVAVDHVGGATPSLAGLQLLLAREWAVAAEQVDIKQVLSLRGRAQSKAKVHVWQEAKVKDLAKEAQAKATAAQPAPAASAEAAPAAEAGQA